MLMQTQIQTLAPLRVVINYSEQIMLFPITLINFGSDSAVLVKNSSFHKRRSWKYYCQSNFGLKWG